MKFNVEINLTGCCRETFATVARHLADIADLTTAGASCTTETAADTTSVVSADPPAEKPRRKRRTKAQIAADKAAEEAAAKANASTLATAESVAAPPAEDPPAEDPLAEDPLADAPASAPTQEEVKAAVVDAIGRLTADGDESPTATVVELLERVTGARRVGEISPDKYHEVIAALLDAGSAF